MRSKKAVQKEELQLNIDFYYNKQLKLGQIFLNHFFVSAGRRFGKDNRGIRLLVFWQRFAARGMSDIISKENLFLIALKHLY